MTKIINLSTKALVFFTVTGIIFILTLINTKLILFLNWKNIGYGLDNYFALFSGIAYALGSISVVIWYNPKLKRNASDSDKKKFRWRIMGAILLKTAFVLCDGIHVYIYQNLNIDDKLLADVASAVFGIQTVLILYFIGSTVDNIIRKKQDKESEIEILESDIGILESEIINYKSHFDHYQREIELNQTKISGLESKIKEYESQLQLTSSQNEKNETKIVNLTSEINRINNDKHKLQILTEEMQSELNEAKNKLATKENIINSFQEHYFKAEKSRILKKREENRTPEEIKLLEEAEKALSDN